jgi:hypothetical protein
MVGLLSALTSGWPTLMTVLDGARLAREPAQSDQFELGHGPIEPFTGEPVSAQCSTEVGPIQKLRARCRHRRRHACFREQLFDIGPSSAVYVVQDPRGHGVLFRPGPHANLEQGGMSERATQQHIETLFSRVIALKARDDRFRRHLPPMPDHPSMKSSELGEVPIEAAARHAELARKDVRLEGLEALARQRLQREIDPVLRGQPFCHGGPTIQYCIDIGNRRRILTVHLCMESEMRDMALQAAGALAILIAIGHGAVAELGVFANSRIEPRRTQTLLRMVWQASTVSWIGIGILLMAAPALGSEVARRWIIAVAVVVYGYGAVGNAVATRGRHVGWCLMGCVIALALVGF